MKVIFDENMAGLGIFERNFAKMDWINYPATLEPLESSQTDLDRMWETHSAYILRSDRPPSAQPGFYPIYRYKDFYSFSILPLILHKGTLNLNHAFERRYLTGNSDVAGPDMTIDREISRIGGPDILDQSISDSMQFVTALARAMQNDVHRITELNPGKTHFVLCGGKDSLNILLLDWRAPVIALSAEPNFPLVQKFVAENDLGIEVRRLEDRHPGSGMVREIAEASCLVDLTHWKWTEHLRMISEEMNHQVIFWKGQLADVTLTDYWRSYTSSANAAYKFLRKTYKILARKAPGPMDLLFSTHAIANLQESLWRRGGVGQGAHIGFLRAICNALVLSAYHGPETKDVMRRIDLHRLTGTDLRPSVGQALLGRPVRYPAENPAPPPSLIRSGKRTVSEYVKALDAFGVSVRSD